MAGWGSGQQWSWERLGPGRTLGVAWPRVSVTRGRQSDGDPRDLGRCGSEGCSRPCCQCRGGAGTPGQLERPSSSVSWRRAQGALWLPGPPFGKALPGSGPRRVVLRRDLGPRAGTARCRAGQGTDRGGLGAGRRSLLEYSWMRGLSREMEPVRGRAGLCGVLAGSVRAAAGAGRAARGRQGAIPGRAGSGGVCPSRPRPRPRPAPGLAGAAVPRGPGNTASARRAGPRDRGSRCGTWDQPWGWPCPRGLHLGVLPPCPVRCPGTAALAPKGTGASPARSPSAVSRAVGLGGSSHGNQPVMEPLSLPRKPVPVSPLP